METLTLKTRLTVTLSLLTALLSGTGYAMDTALLYSMDPQTYNLTLSGHVNVIGRSNDGTEVKMLAHLGEGQILEAVTTTGPDGSFLVSVSFDGYPQQQVDWTLTAHKGQIGTAQEGRQILSDDLAIRLQKSMTLQQDSMVLVSK